MEAPANIPGNPGRCRRYSFSNILTVEQLTKANGVLMFCHQAVFLRLRSAHHCNSNSVNVRNGQVVTVPTGRGAQEKLNRKGFP